MKYALGFAGGFALTMFVHWVAGYEFVRGGVMAGSIVLGMAMGLLGVILVGVAGDIARYDRERR